MATLPQSAQLDGNGRPISPTGWDATNHQYTLQQSGPGVADSTTPNVLYAVGYHALAQIGTTTIVIPADSAPFAGSMPSINMMQTGTAIASPRRTATKLVPLAAVAVTAGTPVSVYTPTTGKKYRILAWGISDTVAGAVKFEDTTGNEVFRSPLLAASTPYNSPDIGNGFLSAAANNQLFLDVTVTGNISGFIAIMEE
jgi:hypothetical protein